MEDYRKKYDDLIERLRKAKNDNDYCDERYCCVIDELAPDVKESEDERIRKALLTYFSDEDESYDGIPYPNICSWIVKQDEKDKEILILKDQIESLHAAIKAIKETYKIELEKQGEQKSVEWSDKDEGELREIIEILTQRPFIGTYFLNKHIAWLKSLRPQNRWKPSGEQMKFLWKYAEQNNYDGRILGTLYNDLKKLREE